MNLSWWLCLVLENAFHKGFTFFRGNHLEANTERLQFGGAGESSQTTALRPGPQGKGPFANSSALASIKSGKYMTSVQEQWWWLCLGF